MPPDDVGGGPDEVPFDATHAELAEETKSLGQVYPTATGKRDRRVPVSRSSARRCVCGCSTGLIGLNTFSAATSLAEALQDHGIATLVGEEAGDPASAFGEYYSSALPHTQLRLNVSSKYFLRPSGVDDGRGVVPDIHVPRAGTLPLATSSDRADSEVAWACRDEPTLPRPGH